MGLAFHSAMNNRLRVDPRQHSDLVGFSPQHCISVRDHRILWKCKTTNQKSSKRLEYRLYNTPYPVAHVQVSPGTEHLQAKLSIGTPYPWSKRTRQCRSKGPRVGNPQHTGFLKTLKKTFQPSKIEWFPSGSQHFQHSMNGKLTTYCPVHCWVHRSGLPGSKHHLNVIVFHAIQPVPIG